MIIGQFCDSYLPAVDGVINVVQNLSYTLNKDYGKCVIVAPKSPGYIDQGEVEVIRCHSMRIKQRPPYMFGMPLLDFKTQDKLLKAKFEILHAHSPFTLGSAALWLARFKGIPVVASFHSKYYDDVFQATKSKMMAKAATQIAMDFYRQADIVLTVNNATIATMREYGYAGEVKILPNGVNCAYPANPQAFIEKVNTMYSLDPCVPLLLFVGQQIWQKGIKTIIDACALLKASGKEFKVLLAGEGHAAQEIKDYTQERGLSDRFIFAGLVKDREVLNGLYLRASLFVFPSIYDNAPLVVREAAVMKCPSIVLKNTNTAEGITDGENGFLCDNSPDALHSYILSILSNDELRKKTGIIAAQTLPTSWEQVADKAYSIYCEAIANKFGKKLSKKRVR